MRYSTPAAVWFVAALVVGMAGCSSCTDDERPGPWPFAEYDASTSDVVPPPDIEDATELGDTRDVTEIDDPTDTRDVRDVDAWQQENVVSEITCEEVREDRTTTIVDSEGTVWIGYHDFGGSNCTEETLVVIHKRSSGPWVEEEIQPHESPLFQLSSIRPDRPIIVYPDHAADEFRTAERTSDGSWSFHEFDIDRYPTDRFDVGFDSTNDGERFFVTFAGGESDVELFARGAGEPGNGWRKRRTLNVAEPQAAMERGLRADRGDSVYLVHNNLFGAGGKPARIARYDKEDDLWADHASLDDRYRGAFAHSLVVTDDRELCMSHRTNDGNLLITCGSMVDLDEDAWNFRDRPIADGYPSSLVEGRDGTLYTAFHDEGNTELNVAKRADGEWTFRTVYDGSSYGVSTAIDHSGDMVLSFYTCDEPPGPNCSLKMVREDPTSF